MSVTQTPCFGKAYNLKPRGDQPGRQPPHRQGFLVGSSRFQNEDVDYMNRIILGRSIPKFVIPR